MMQRALLVLFAACGGVYGGRPAKPVKPLSGIEAAGMPAQMLDARTGHQIDEAAFWDKLGTMRAVCVGEEHTNPHHHWLQLEVVRKLFAKWPESALGMEMFQRPFQGVLDDYAARRIDEAALRSRAGWEDRWGYDYGLYGPTIATAVDAHASLIALNAAKELTKKISHKGIESLTPEEASQVPELDLKDATHRAWFDALMEDMGGTSAHAQTKPKDDDDRDPASKPAPNHGDDEAMEMSSADRIYTVQVTWDETMADTAAKWLTAHPNGRMVILAGTGHCHDSAIVHRMQRRGIKDVVSIRTVVDDGQGAVAEALAKPMTDYVVVLTRGKN